MTRRRNICPYKEELFTRPDWAGYRNALQKWRKQCKLIAIPKVILPPERLSFYYLFNDKSEIKKQKKDASIEHLVQWKEISTKEVFSITSYQKGKNRFKNMAFRTISSCILIAQ